MASNTALKRLGESVIGTLPDGPRIALRRFLRHHKERHRLARADFSVIAHPKSGSTWLRFQLARLYQRRFGLPESLLPRLETYHSLNPAVPVLHMAGYEYMKHVVAAPEPAAELESKAAVVMVRHPIDIIVSLYFHIQKHALRERKLFNDWPLDLSGTSMMDFALRSHWGLRETISFYNNCARHMTHMRRVKIVRYEDMRGDAVGALKDIVAFAGGKFTDDDIAEAVSFTSFEKMREAEKNNTFASTRLRPGDPRDSDSFKVRRGKAYGYRDYFSAAESQLLDEIVERELDPVYAYGRDRRSAAT